MKLRLRKGVLACFIIGIIFIILGLLLPIGDKTYTVYFDTNGGSIVSNQEIKENGTITKPADPTKENYVFLRWEYNESEFDFSTKVTQRMTLKAIWGEGLETTKYKISFVVAGDIKEIEVSNANEINLSNLGYEEKAGYELKWYLDGKEYDLLTPITSDIKLEGKYVKVTSLTVKFDSQGGSAVKSQSLKSGEIATEPVDVTYEGFIFNGWYLNNKKYDFSTPVTKSITLVAKWDEDPSFKRYTVKFDSDGGSKVADQRVIENKTATLPKEPTKTDYKFVEWQLNNKKYDFKTKVTADITLKAKWEEDLQYTVTFNVDGKITTVKVKAGEKVDKPSNPTKSGYTFVEWLKDNVKYDFNLPVNSNITLTARFMINRGTPEPVTPTVTATPTPRPTVTPTPRPTVNPTPTSTPTPKSYTFKAIPVDDYSPDVEIQLYDGNNNIVNYSSMTIDGTVIQGKVVNKYEYGNSITFKLSDGTTVTATKN